MHMAMSSLGMLQTDVDTEMELAKMETDIPHNQAQTKCSA